MNKTAKNLIAYTFGLGAVIIALNGTVYAQAACNPGPYGTRDCTPDIEVTKKVRKEGQKTWRDIVYGVKEDQKVKFLITIKNTGKVTLYDVKVKDILPGEMYWVDKKDLDTVIKKLVPCDSVEVDTGEKCEVELGGDEGLVAKVEDQEYDDDDFNKCVENKAEAIGTAYVGSSERIVKDSDNALVCYGRDEDNDDDDDEDDEPSELPETGANALVSVVGLGAVALGSLLKRSRN